MSNVVLKVQEKQRQEMKYKYPLGIELRITGDEYKGYTLQARCLKRMEWENIKYVHIGRPGSVNAGVSLMEIVGEAHSLVKQLKKYGVNARYITKSEGNHG